MGGSWPKAKPATHSTIFLNTLRVASAGIWKFSQLSEPPGIEMFVSDAGDTWYAWRRTISGWVFAIGAAIDLSPSVTLRAGYNYGRSPVPLNNLNPLLAAIGERHFTAGLAHKLSPGWTIGYGIEYQQSANPKYTNAALPFGPNAQERSNFPALHFMSSHRW